MKLSKQGRTNLTGYLFIAPNIIGFIIFLLIPVVLSLGISFTSWNILGGLEALKWVGLKNYQRLPLDAYFVKSLWNNVVYTLKFVPITMGLALLLAVVMNKKIYGRSVIRAMFFIPFISNIVAISAVWMAFFQPETGPINKMLMMFGMQNPPQWLASSATALDSIVIVNVWLNFGYTMVIYLAGLQNIPKDVYEAADIDGAGPVRKFVKITWPMLSPTTFFILITTMINSFKVFGTVNVMTQGGPGDATSVIVFYIYQTAFRFYKMGYAAAMSWILFIIIFAITLVQWQGQKKWVGYSL